MATFTVFAFGTGEKSTMKKKNIISQFSEACTGEHTIIEGPGTLGREVASNVRKKTKEITDWLIKQDDDENSINLTGFSRGSVTCMRIANQLKKIETSLATRKEELSADEKKLLTRLKALNLHIFAIDPVAGMSDKSHIGARVIPSNVKSFVAILQTDEMRRDFKPQDMSRIIIASPEKTKVSLLPMYGNHSDSTKIKNDGMKSGPKLVWYALHQFLTQHATTLKGDKLPQIVTSQMKFSNLPENPNSKDLLKLFTSNHQERNKYLASGQVVKFADGLPIPRKIRSFNKHLEYYVKNSDFFTNQLERELFKISYPKVFNYVFERNQFDLRFPEASGCKKEDVIAELSELKKENLDLFARLKKYGIAQSEQSIILGQPSGSYCLEPCATLQQIYPAIVPNSVKERAPEMAKLANLEAEIYRLTFKYEREKSELSPFTARAQSGYTKAIREQVKNLINDKPGDRESKYLKALDKVEEYYIRLIQSRSESELTDMLGKLLANHGRHYKVEMGSLPRSILANFIHANLNLLKETIGFIGNLGYVGGGLFAFVGNTLQDFGRRCNEMLGTLGYNPLKYVASALAYTFEGIGFALKNMFGLKPLTNFITDSIKDIRNEMVIAVGGVKVSNVLSNDLAAEKLNPEDDQDNLHEETPSSPTLV